MKYYLKSDLDKARQLSEDNPFVEINYDRLILFERVKTCGLPEAGSAVLVSGSHCIEHWVGVLWEELSTIPSDSMIINRFGDTMTADQMREMVLNSAAIGPSEVGRRRAYINSIRDVVFPSKETPVAS